MAKLLRQSTASQEFVIGTMVDSTDGNAQETGLTILNTDIKLWKHGGTSIVNKNSGGATHMALGRYSAVLDATDTDTLGNFKIFVHVTGALEWQDSFIVVPANIFDSIVLGTDTLDTQVTGMGTGVITAAVIADGAIDAATFAASAITSTVLAADCITAAKVAADVTTEIQSGLATAASITTIDDFLDTEILAIKAVTDKLDTTMELDGAVYRFTTNALEQGTGGGGTNALILRDSIAQGGGAAIITLDAGASSTNDLYKYDIVAINGGTGEGQSRQIVGYDGTTKQCLVSPDWVVVPNATSEFVIGALGVDAATLDNIEDEIWDALRIDHAVSGSFGEYVFADMTRISGDSVAADNAEAFFDGTGLALTGALLPWNPAWDAEVQSEVNDALEAIHLDHLLAADYDPSSKPGVSTALFNELIENDSGVSRYTANALEQGPSGGGGGGGGGDGSTYTAIPWNSAWDAEIESEVNDALAAYGVPSTTYLDSRSLASSDYANATDLAAVETDTQDIQSRLPADLENGRMRSKVEQVVDKVLGVGGTGGHSIGGT